jgi:hypothetical protein
MTASRRGWLPGHPVGWGVRSAVAGTVTILVGTFLPWLRSGTVWRNSYEVWESADRLGVISGGVERLLLVTWFLLGVLGGCVVLAFGLHRVRLAILLALPVATIAVTGAALAMAAPLPAGAGPTVTLLGGLVVCVGTGAELRSLRRERGEHVDQVGRGSGEDP